MTSQFSNMTSSSFFWRCFLSLVNFSYWSKFHVNIDTGSQIMTVFFYKGLTRNPEIGNTPICVLPNIWRLGGGGGGGGGVWKPNLAWISLIKCYWMLQISRVTAFTVIELLRENQLGGKITPPTQIRVKCISECEIFWSTIDKVFILFLMCLLPYSS